jgi:hypothetical protein
MVAVKLTHYPLLEQAVLSGLNARIDSVRRLAFAIIVAWLTVSASGLSSLIIPEPCLGYELAGSDPGTCPPTCVTCGCCARGAEPVVLRAMSAPDVPVCYVPFALPRLPKTDPRAILHVPKLRLA